MFFKRLKPKCQLTVLDKSFEKKLKKQWLFSSVQIIDSAGNSFKSKKLNVPEIKIGDLRIKNHSVILYDFEYINTIAKQKKKLSGCIGMDLLKKYIFQINFKKNKIFFYEQSAVNIFSKIKRNKYPEGGRKIKGVRSLLN